MVQGGAGGCLLKQSQPHVSHKSLAKRCRHARQESDMRPNVLVFEPHMLSYRAATGAVLGLCRDSSISLAYPARSL
ncbi:hypothetical protein E2C01_024467 [Portunus trituberculatus]|uniref:Uncharacterized protein n=1 Tax=Portunus trituberculatus TaxID=210409 RepID=A0A5B7ECS7_PORTR|nr:hypothetical protein [Portunus trituberculatus]